MSGVRLPLKVGLEQFAELKEPIGVRELQGKLGGISLSLLDRSVNRDLRSGRRAGTLTNHGVRFRYEFSDRNNHYIDHPFELVHQKAGRSTSIYPQYGIGSVIVARLMDPIRLDSAWPNESSPYLPEPPTIAFTSGKFNDLWGNFNPGTADLDVERTTVQVVEPESPAAQVLAHIAAGLERGISELFQADPQS